VKRVALQGAAQVIVLDTGLASGKERPHLLDRLPDGAAYDRERPDEDINDLLDPCAGHGTYAAGIVQQLLPDVPLGVGRVLSTFGDGDEIRIGMHIADILEHGINGGDGGDGRDRVDIGEHTILNLSFSGYALESMAFLATVLRRVQQRGAVVVASAGNDGWSRPTYPAALHGVISVGALGTDGPAPFSNFGPWVRACAPGVDLVSCFFRHFNGSLRPLPGSPDPDRFRGWARWSGTSFSAPIVAATLASEMNRCGCTAREAVARVIDAPGLYHVPWLGTAVNVMWPQRV
jgi:subtilisin family serine protease